MPTARCRSWLPFSIGSIVNQTYPFVDLYVVDDATDDISDELIGRFPEATFLRMQNPGGPYVIDNLLHRTTRSKFIAFQDADDISYLNRFEIQLNLMQMQRLAGCGTWSIHIDTFGDPVGYEIFPADASEAIFTRNLYPLRHPSALLHREVLDKIGGFDNAARFGGDSEYLFRTFLSYRMGNVQQFLYKHMIRPDSLTQSPETGFNSERRKEYDQALVANMYAIIDGKKSPPEFGKLIDGRDAGITSLPPYELIHLGKNNKTWTGG